MEYEKFTVICNKCGSKNVLVCGSYDGNYIMICQNDDCDNAIDSYEE